MPQGLDFSCPTQSVRDMVHRDQISRCPQTSSLNRIIDESGKSHFGRRFRYPTNGIYQRLYCGGQFPKPKVDDYVCGIENPIGLHLAFYGDNEGRCIARFRPKPEHQGYPGQLHGGIISSLTDEPTQISVLASVLAV
jgi:hypothetical protein